MKKDAVPQQVSSTYGGQRKLFYAVDDDGAYSGIQSSGWEPETTATLAAVAELERLRNDAWQRARDGATSPLEFHMYQRRMDITTLAQVTGLWRWRIRRHLLPKHFTRLSARVLQRYADALDLTAAELTSLPSQPDI